MTLCFEEELELFRTPVGERQKEGDEELDALFEETGAHARFEELLAVAARRGGPASGPLSERLWQAAWRGTLTQEGFAGLRRAALGGFKVASEAPPTRRGGGRRRAFERWRGSRPLGVLWRRLPTPEPADPLEEHERERDRARQLLERYGVVFRELLAREMPALQWRGVFRALRLLELAGECVTGHFFEGVPGLQFAAHDAVRQLERGLDEDAMYWMCAIDPASPCGLGLPGLPDALPARTPSSHLVYHGARLVLVSRRQGRELTILVPPDHPRLPDYVALVSARLGRDFDPAPRLEIERINDESARSSPYAQAFRAHGYERTHKSLELRR